MNVSSCTLSIIIPTWREDYDKAISLIASHQETPGTEWIIACHQAPDNWEDQIQQLAWQTPPKVIHCPEAGRGIQLNRGAEAASGTLLVFNHADTVITPDHLTALRNQSPQAGAFHRILGKRHERISGLNGLVRWFNQHFGILLGDQSVFVHKTKFEEIGGFREIKIMEDVDLSRRLRRAEKITLLDPPIYSSARRFKQLGSARATISNLILITLFQLGVSPNYLHKVYYRHRSSKNN